MTSSSAPTLARRLHAEGVDATGNGRPELGARRLRAALAQLGGICEPDGATLRGRILVSLAHAEAEQGNVRGGLRLLNDAEPLLPQPERGVLHGQRGLLLLRIGRGADALPEFDAALTLLRRAGQPADLTKILLNRAVAHLAAGRVTAARADLRRCGELARDHTLARMAAKAMHNLGYLDYLAGDLPSALRTFQTVAVAYDEHAPDVAPVLAVDRARALLAAGLFRDADRELESALDRFRAQRLSQDYAEALLARAEAALVGGRPGAARQWAVRARARFRRRGNALWTALASLVMLRAELELNRPAGSAGPPAGTAGSAGPPVGSAGSPGALVSGAAAATAQGAGWATGIARRAASVAAVLRSCGLAEDARLAGVLAVRALLAAGRSADAAATLTALGLPARGGRLDVRLAWRLARAECAAAAGRAGDQSRELRTGLDELSRQRAQLGSLDLQTGAAAHGQALAAAGLATALAARSPARAFRWAERARAQAMLLPPVHPPEDPQAAAALEELRLARSALRAAELAGRAAGPLRLRCATLERTLRQHAWVAAGPGVGARVVSLAETEAELGDRVLVSYLRDGQALRALVVRAGAASFLDLGSYAAAAEALCRLRADLDAIAGRALPERMAHAALLAARRDAGVLADHLVAPLIEQIGEKELVVVPTGVLVMTPWRLLPGCADRPVTVAPSATVWCTASRRAHQTAPHGRSVLVAGPGTAHGEAEVHAIAALRPGAVLLTGPAATAPATRAALDGADVAHLAAHGHHEPDNALFSSLDLVGGPLMGYDVQKLARPPRMVVLSSCDLGLTDVRPGDEAIGMAAALLAAGSCTVVASVSRVGDSAALRVMTEFHRQVAAGGAAPAQALARATVDEALSSFVCFGAG